jgi:hypothetical protein
MASLVVDRVFPDGRPGEAEIAAAGLLLQDGSVAGLWPLTRRGSRPPFDPAERRRGNDCGACAEHSELRRWGGRRPERRQSQLSLDGPK